MRNIMRVLAIILALCLLLAGCGEIPGETNPLTDGKGSNSSETKPKEETAEEKTAADITIPEAIIYESDSVTITVKGIEESWLGMDIKLLVENRTDKNIAISGMDFVVNGITMTGNMYIDVAAGKKANGVISLLSDELNTAGITGVATVRTCDAHVVDTTEYDTLEDIELYIVTSLGEEYVQTLDESGTLLYEHNGIQVIAKVMEEELYGKSILLYVKNPGQKDITVQAENVSVNGFTIDGWLYSLVCGETSRFCELDLLETTLEENSITEIEEVTFTISLVDPESWATIASSEELQVIVGE